MSDSDLQLKYSSMREAARAIFQQALAEASIRKGFERHVQCDRGVLRVCEDLYDLHSYSRVQVISMGKAAHTMAEALSQEVGGSLDGIVASSVESASQVRGFRYFAGGHPTPNAESVRAAGAILTALSHETVASLVIF